MIIGIASVVLVAALAVLAVLIFQPKEEMIEDAEGVVGRIYDDWDPGVQQADDSSKNPSQGVQIPGYSMAEMKEGDTTLKLSIGNPKENNCGFYASVELDDGTVLYESEILKPGQGLTVIPLSQTLKKGTYDAAVCYNCVTLSEKHTPLNSARSEFTLVVN